VLSSELIQEYLDENEVIISCIIENQNMGKMSACAEYQKKLQSNLFFLASLADQANEHEQRQSAAKQEMTQSIRNSAQDKMSNDSVTQLTQT